MSGVSLEKTQTVISACVDIPEQNIHPIDGTLEPKVAAEQYADVIADGPFDLVLLGLGQDGHTASLFPNTPDLSQERRAVIATTSPLPPKHRISLSLKTINAARKVSFFVLGSGKSEVLTRVIAERDLPEPNLPASLVCPTTGTVTWFVDQEAASNLRQESVAAPTGKCPDNGPPVL
jgi:6-phosphogluconolactonase